MLFFRFCRMYLVSSCYQVSMSRQKLMYNFRGNFAVICGHTQVYVPHDTFLTHTYSYFGISILSKSYHELHTSYMSKKYVSTCAHHLRKVSGLFLVTEVHYWDIILSIVIYLLLLVCIRKLRHVIILTTISLVSFNGKMGSW